MTHNPKHKQTYKDMNMISNIFTYSKYIFILKKKLNQQNLLVLRLGPGRQKTVFAAEFQGKFWTPEIDIRPQQSPAFREHRGDRWILPDPSCPYWAIKMSNRSV